MYISIFLENLFRNARHNGSSFPFFSREGELLNMRWNIYLFMVILISVPVHGGVFFIESGSGGSDPLLPGDIVAVAQSSGFMGHVYQEGYFVFYQSDNYYGQVRFSEDHITIAGDQMVGSQLLDVGSFGYCDTVRMHIVTSYNQSLYHWVSVNTLRIEPTAPPLPAFSAWGIGLVLLVFSVTLAYTSFRSRSKLGCFRSRRHG